MKEFFLTAVIASIWIVAAISAGHATEAASEPADLLLIVDASGSMWGQIDGENKIVIARRVLAELVADLPDEIEVGLIAYGHRRDGDCADIETVVPMGPLNRPSLIGVLDALNPKGKTPITASIQAGLEAIDGRESATTMILVSDGLETCGGDPCAAVAAAREAGGRFLLHVVGFGIDEGDVSQLECAAQAGGGLYLAAADAGQLQDALGRAVEASAAPDESPTTLVVGAVGNGDLIDAMVEVKAIGDDEVAFTGRTYTGVETNPRRFPVPPGSYDITVRAVRLNGEPIIRLEGIEVPGGEVVEQRVDFSSGTLAIAVTRNGALADATVKVSSTDGKTSVASGRTYTGDTSNPKVFELTPGEYLVEAHILEIKNAPTESWSSVVVRPGERTDLAYDLASGELQVGVVDGDQLVDAVVAIKRDGASVAGGRTYTAATSNPKAFILEPGTYIVEVRAVRHADNEQRTLEVTVEAGTTTTRTVHLGGG